jgi:hypothetical protein
MGRWPPVCCGPLHSRLSRREEFGWGRVSRIPMLQAGRRGMDLELWLIPSFFENVSYFRILGY